MSVNDDENNSKVNNINMKSPIYFSPYAHKKKVIGNLYTETKRIPIQSDPALKNKTKQKISNPILTKNIINLNPQECFKKGSKILICQVNDKSYQQRKSKPQSYKKVNSKLYLKKNAIPNLSSFNENNSNVVTTHLGTNSNMNTQSNNSRNAKLYKNKPPNMKFNMGNRNYLNNYTSVKGSTHNLKKSAGSATELFGNNMIKKTKTKNSADLNNININQIGYILTSPGNNNKQFFSPHAPSQKIIFIKNDNNKLKDKNVGHNISKDSLKVFPNQSNEQIDNNIDSKNKSEIQYLLRNTYNNVKIYPTTFLNNKIIYQTESNNNSNINNFINNNHNTSRPYIKTSIEKKENLNKKNSYENIGSVEEVHFLYVNTIQKGNNLILKMDK